MIFIDRSRVQCPPVLNHCDSSSPGACETAHAIALHAASKKPTFAIYKHDTVKLALAKLFNEKCAYCETKIGAASAKDIEHFRPKMRINPGQGKKTIKQGYYWLAATWDNLLLACPGCNRSQRQVMRDALGNPIFHPTSTGKLDQFPLRDEQYRVMNHADDLSREEDHRLLLNPCIDHPEQYLRYDTDGNILPQRIAGQLSDRALCSIEVYQLKRLLLVDERKAKYLVLVNAWSVLEQIRKFIPEMTFAQSATIGKIIRLQEDTIMHMMEESEPYAGMLRYLWEPHAGEMAAIKQEFTARFGQPI